MHIVQVLPSLTQLSLLHQLQNSIQSIEELRKIKKERQDRQWEWVPIKHTSSLPYPRTFHNTHLITMQQVVYTMFVLLQDVFALLSVDISSPSFFSRVIHACWSNSATGGRERGEV